MNSLPSISVITPTKGRPEMMKRCLISFLNQDYQGDKELIFVADQLSDMPLMPYTFWEPNKISGLLEDGSVGHKLNEGISLAKSDIIVRMDSDDSYSPSYITKSVSTLISSGANLTGMSQAYFHDIDQNKAYFYKYKGGQPSMLGATMTFHRKTWERNPFREDVKIGEDSLFMLKAGKTHWHDHINDFIATTHSGNTSPRAIHDGNWKEVPLSDLPRW